MTLIPDMPRNEILTENLPGGLTVILAPRPGSGVVTVDTWVAVGSADEPPRISGVSHFLEHMLFKGTERYGVGEIDRLIEGVGGLINAGTSHDFTHYHVTVATPNFPTALHVISEIVQNAAIDENELNSERQVIIEEYSIKQDNPQGLLFEELYERAFLTGPYRLPVLGVPETLQATGRAEMLDYYQRHYCPERMALMIVGDIEPGPALEAARKAFDGFERPYRPLVPSVPTTAYAVSGEHVIEKEVNETYGAIALPAPPLTDHDEAYGLDVLQFVLGGGHASLLYQEVKEKRRLANSIHMGYSSSRYPDLFYVYFSCDESKRAELEQAVYEQFDRVIQSPPPPEALHRARKLLANSHAFSLETTQGQSSSIGYFYTITGDIEFEKNYIEGVSRVTAEQVQDLARKWLATRDTTRMIIRPKRV